jgi:hypothetical protein
MDQAKQYLQHFAVAQQLAIPSAPMQQGQPIIYPQNALALHAALARAPALSAAASQTIPLPSQDPHSFVAGFAPFHQESIDDMALSYPQFGRQYDLSINFDFSMDHDQHADIRSASGSSVQPDFPSSEGMPTDMSQSPTFFESNFIINELPTPSYEPKLMHKPNIRDKLLFDLRGDMSLAASLLPESFGGFDDFLGDMPPGELEPAEHFDMGQFVHLERFY